MPIPRRSVHTSLLLLAVLGPSLWPATASTQQSRRGAVYYPGPHPQWERRSAATLGLDARLLDSAVGFSKTKTTRVPRDF